MVENDLLNAKKRDHKIYITDVAIEKFRLFDIKD